MQYDVIKLLAGDRKNLFVVGDDDQSIYRFRGARPEIMLHFPKDYPEAKSVLLDMNYRSDAEIVKHALRLIAHNRARFDKKIRAEKPAVAQVEYALFKDQKEENLKIIDRKSVV